jgi:hypothetical protein
MVPKYSLAKPVDSDAEPAGNAHVSDVVDIANLPGNNAFSVGRRRSAAIDAPASAGGPAAAAAAPPAAAAAAAAAAEAAAAAAAG